MRVAAAATLLLCGCYSSPESKRSTGPSRARPAAAKPYGQEFRELWKDSQAEVSSYELSGKNGQKGTATLLFAMTQFSKSSQAEGDPQRQGGADLIPAMKLNLLKRAGDRSEMVTVFAALTETEGLPAGAVNQVGFSTQSMTGQSWGLMTLSSLGVTAWNRSFSRGESQRRIEYRDSMLPADALPLVARRIAWPRLRLGQRYGVQLISAVNDTARPEVQPALLFMSQERRTAVVPAGSFRVRAFRATATNQPTRTWYVEADEPFRIVRWEFSNGESAELVSSTRGTPDR
jgi:hypothetical protein